MSSESNPTHDPANAIAVIGGGIAGLTAARSLADAGRPVQVFDKGRGVSGRTSIRYADGDRQFDHGAQYFTARSEAFTQQIEAWAADGIAAEWQARIATIECDDNGCRLGEPPSAKVRYVGCPGMNAPAKRLAEQVVAAGGEVRAGVRVAPLKRLSGLWRLVSETGESLGDYAKVLVTSPAPQATELMTASPALSNAAKSVRMNGSWAAMVAFGEEVAPDFDAAFVNGPVSATALSWIARNGSKPGRPDAATTGDCWVLHGSSEWSEANMELAPDEAAAALLAAFGKAIDAQLPSPVHCTAHRWRFALPETPLTESSLADPTIGLYAAGDWCGGPRVEGAYLSGLAAAERILAS
ncbi:MAG: FAD-dependent oxidoreductase [Planctomycetota bacterium]